MKETKEKQMQRVVTFLNREELDFLDKLGKDALFSTGLKISRAKLISWIIEFLIKLNLDGKNLKNLEDLEEKIRELIKGQSREV
ncbi:MAG: hypothetical protein N2Z79_04580 [Candidatus Omnitrophica bacterium]|nr:hypothetical protein [Candidatus Omnitrophota bacterium]